MDIIEATASFEKWLMEQTVIVESDLLYKHGQMKREPFLFLRASFYHWLQRFYELLPELSQTPFIPAVGDLHVENFGTWRDAEGRLVWGVNDFDEAAFLPYTNDLVRLAVSAAMGCYRLNTALEDYAKPILEGYIQGLQDGGSPFILEEKHHELRRMAQGALTDPHHFWEHFDQHIAPVEHALPNKAIKAFREYLPEDIQPEYFIVKTPKGLGSLGRQRYIATATWRGGRIAREAKAFVPSAVNWISGSDTVSKKTVNRMIDQAVRSPDPHWAIKGKWIVRRLSPDCRRIDLEDVASERDIYKLLYSMGYETANIHLGDPNAKTKILDDLAHRHEGWLKEAYERMMKAMTEDWGAWKDAPEIPIPAPVVGNES